MATLLTTAGDCTERPARPDELVIEGSVEISSFGAPLTVTPAPAAEVVTSEAFDAFLAAQVEAALTTGFPVP